MVPLLNSKRSRRSFIESIGIAGATMLLPATAYSQQHHLQHPLRTRDTADLDGIDPDIKKLASTAIDAATTAGATYADVRITRTKSKQISTQSERDLDEYIAGVRVLADGAWGFSANTQIDADTMAWLGKTSTEIAKANVWSHVDPIAWDPVPATTGTWQTPIQKDPFLVTKEERQETYQKFIKALQVHSGQSFSYQVNFGLQDRFFASSEGTSVNQRIYTAFNNQPASMFFKPNSMVFATHTNGWRMPLSNISPVGAGWEAFDSSDQYIPQALEHAARLIEGTPLDQPGKYEVVFDGAAMAALVSVLGKASEIDRALGMEAAAGEQSFLAPINEKLGQRLFPSSVNLIADRNMPKGAATVGWDDEGIVPSTFALIKDGVFVDYGTGREYVSEIKDWYKTQGKPGTSHGCMAAASGLFMPLVSSPNLTLVPSAQNVEFNDLIADIKQGFAVFGGTVDMDDRLATGWGVEPTIYLVRNGKLINPVSQATYTFSILDHWKNLIALGGPGTVSMHGFTQTKGSPLQSMTHSVSACAAKFKDVTIRSVGLTRAF